MRVGYSSFCQLFSFFSCPLPGVSQPAPAAILIPNPPLERTPLLLSGVKPSSDREIQCRWLGQWQNGGKLFLAAGRPLFLRRWLCIRQRPPSAEHTWDQLRSRPLWPVSPDRQSRRPGCFILPRTLFLSIRGRSRSGFPSSAILPIPFMASGTACLIAARMRATAYM